MPRRRFILPRPQPHVAAAAVHQQQEVAATSMRLQGDWPAEVAVHELEEVAGVVLRHLWERKLQLVDVLDERETVQHLACKAP